MAARIIFWIAIAIPAYAYLGYPIVLLLLRLIVHRAVKKALVEPCVSFVIPAYNEAKVIEQKIRNTLALDYPPEKLEIVVASDGSKDGTATIAQQFEDGKRVRVFAYPENRGK